MERWFVFGWIVVLLVVQPLTAWRNQHRLKGRVRRMRTYVSSFIGIGVIGLITLVIDTQAGGVALQALAGEAPDGGIWKQAGLTFLASVAVWLASQMLRRYRREPPSEMYVNILPRTAMEKVAFSVNSMWAGLVEEYAFRGFCMLNLRALTGSWTIAFLLTTVGFGLGHLYQGAGGAVRTGVAGAVFAIPVMSTGVLLPSVLAHGGVNMVSGLFTLGMLKRWGMVAEDKNEEAAAAE